MQSLLGLLNFACRVVASDRALYRRLISATCIIGIKIQHNKIRVTNTIMLDLKVWKNFLKRYNGVAVINPKYLDSNTIQLFTNSIGVVNAVFGIYFGRKWTSGRRPQFWFSLGIAMELTFLEPFPVIVALTLYDKYLQNSKMLFHIDSMSILVQINKQI